MGLLSEKIIEIGIDAGLTHIADRAKDQAFSRDYKKAVEEYLERQWGEFAEASLEEEFDFAGLCDLLRSPGMAEKLKVAVAGTQAQRRQARAALESAAIAHAHASTSESRKRVRKIVSAITDALRQLERDKVPLEFRTLAADSVAEINAHADENTERVLEEIRELRRECREEARDGDKAQFADLRSAILDNGGRRLGDHGIVFNLQKMNREILGFADDRDIQFMKAQLGDRLGGNETREEVITLFWAETQMTYHSGRRHGVMPIFQDVVRDTCMASICVDQMPRIVDRVHLARFYWDEFDIFHLKGERYVLRFLLWNGTPAAVSMSYSFGDLPDVHERLFYFEKIRPIVESKSLRVTGEGMENYDFCVDMTDLGEDWRSHVELTEGWIDQMHKIAEIEQHYQVHFDLPRKAKEEDYIAVEILYDSLHRRCCRTLPGLPGKDLQEAYREEGIVFEEELSIGCPDCLMDVELFGKTFKPVDEYIIPCELVWNEEEACFETPEGGVPTGVEFSLRSRL